MLVITRRLEESLVIGDPRNPVGVVQIVSVKGDCVRLGITADTSVAIHRAEVAEKVLKERERAQKGEQKGRVA